MRILEINIQNFRKLLQCHIEFSEKTTLFVGANNSGKTSAMDALGKFLADRNFTFNDITISERSAINVIGERWIQKDCEEPTTITEWESLMPKMDIWLNVASSIAYEGNDEEAIASTFEDCLVYTNYQLFKTIATDDTGSLIKSVSDGINIADSFETFHKGVYDTLRNGKSDQKAEFALDLIYAVDPNELIVPAYIDEGLKWLQAYLDPEE